MVLDTSRLPKSEIMWVIETYHTHIVNLHLSAVTRERGLNGIAKQYQPVERDNFCLDLLDRLQELEWNGVVTLEYMPWLHAKVLKTGSSSTGSTGSGGHKRISNQTKKAGM